MHRFNNIDLNLSQSGYIIANLHPCDYDHFVHKSIEQALGYLGKEAT